MKIYLVRHGESWHNHFYEMNIKNPPIKDPPLTLKGKIQAYNIREPVKKIDADLIVSSPLTRAIQTTLLIRTKEKVVITSLHTETMTSQGDIGTPKSELKEKYKNLNFDYIEDEIWWYPSEKEPQDSVKKRVELFKQFLKYLESLKFEKIIVVGHSNFFWYLLGRKPSNCEICEYTIPQNTAP